MSDNSEHSSQDLLSDIIRSVRLTGSVFFRSKLSAPWGISLPAADEPRFHIVLGGQAWLHAENMAEPFLMRAGTAMLLRDGEAHWIADNPATPKVSSETASAAVERGEPLFQGESADCHMLCGYFRFDRDISHPLISTLPERNLVADEDGNGLDWLKRTAALMDGEVVDAQPGSVAMMDRICELFLIQILRHLMKRDGETAGFVGALDDAYINKALRQIHADPAQAWNLENLSDIAGLSRSAFAKRFHELVGMPPKSYLTMWRMQKARSLLRNPYKLLEQIATEVGYSSDVALIRAFQRQFGKSPTEMRRELAKSIH
ncbi:MAG: AraC family transcriptional regulator [Pseudomonadota bacterium]